MGFFSIYEYKLSLYYFMVFNGKFVPSLYLKAVKVQKIGLNLFYFALICT